ncbi:hypothetical protein [Bradyrhizobium roseum]|uniref:hypothetical protein n=1 Tax=Bradyrhizobium roseum TaxID=3056648 RepID=UPI002629D1F6|nr:hypothetical protein [Bradyrhizobium roseus]WKA31336.1 hypothetical protein QUH67_14740 [Bradyrhizobium roseus]
MTELTVIALAANVQYSIGNRPDRSEKNWRLHLMAGSKSAGQRERTHHILEEGNGGTDWDDALEYALDMRGLDTIRSPTRSPRHGQKGKRG